MALAQSHRLALLSRRVRVYAAGHEELLPEDGCVLLLRVLYGRVLWRGQARHLRRSVELKIP